MEELKPIQLKSVIKTSNRVEMAKLVVNIVATMKGLSLSKTEIIVLTHFITEGFNQVTREALVTNKIMGTLGGVSNIVSRLRKYGLIVQNGYKEELCKELNFQLGDLLLLKILLDNR